MLKKITDKIDNVTGIPDEYRKTELPAPISVKIELTSRCNFKCAFCATGYKLRDKGEMDETFYLKLLDDLKASGVQEVGMFFLGESMLLDVLPKRIKQAKDAGFEYVYLTTNGSLATPDKVRDCMEAGLDSLKFSLNYADEQQFAEISQVKATLFYDMLCNIEAAWHVREEGDYECGLFASYIQYTGEQMEKMKPLLADLAPFLDEMYSLPLYSQADFTGEDNAEKGWNVRAGNPGRYEAMRSPLPCWSLFTETRVTHDGHVAACCFDHDGKFDMGDLNEMPFMEAWNNPAFQELRASHLDKDVAGTVCEGCVAWN
jgi:MoaA/NifB/PqqE/SkfB family radical SAM enzyme